MINILEYDEMKLAEDEREIEDIANNIRQEVTNLNQELKKASLLKLINSQDEIIDNISKDYERLLEVCNELVHITSCIEQSRKKYNQCEEKISDLLDRIRFN